MPFRALVPPRVGRVLPAVAALLVGASGPAPVGAAAQAGTDASDAALAASTDSLMYVEGDAGGALALLEGRLAAGPEAYALRWRAARAATALGVVREGEEDEARRDSLYRAAVEHGRRARDARSDGVEGWYWGVAAKGRLSLHADARTAVALAEEIDAEAREVLRLDSLHAGGHNALGRLNLEVMILPGWKRAAGRLLSGAAFDGMSWDAAERHLQRAVELEPGNALYLRDLGELHLRRGRPTAAAVLLRRLTDREGLPPWDRVFQDEARDMLAEIDARAR